MGSISFINKVSSGGNIKPNIFMQETEPETKEGIWIQSNKNYEKIDVLDSYSETLEWKEPNNISPDILGDTTFMFSINNKIS